MAREQYTKAPKVEPAAPVTESKPAVSVAALGTIPAEPLAPAEPKSDRYRVKGPGGVFANGILHPAGAELQLSELDALSVLEQLETI